MTKRFLGFGDRFLSSSLFVGRGNPLPTPIALDPAIYEGAAAYGADGQFYYSDGLTWRIPTDTVDVARPTALPPTNSQEAMRLRLSPFFSPRGLSQTGIFFEVAETQDGFDNPLFTRSITSTTASEYQTIFPDDGLVSGQEFWWRALYTSTEGGQSEFSLPFRQVYPDQIDRPFPVTRDGATSGEVELTPFNSVFNLNYVETEFQFWPFGADPDVDTPVETVTTGSGSSVLLPESLIEGDAYLWRGRYGGRVGAGGALTYSDWSSVRTVFNGAATMQLVYDVDLMLNRTVQLPLGVYGGIVDVVIDWGDGVVQSRQSSGIISHTYAPEVTGLVTVSISGQLEQYGGNANIQGLVRVDNIGFKLGLTSLREMFRNLTSNTTVVNAAIPPQVKNIQSMFAGASAIAFDITGWNTSEIENMSSLFKSLAFFNQDIGQWDVSSATNMSSMFENATVFNRNIGNWDVSQVTDMNSMFAGATAFNQPIGGWDVSSVTRMDRMFLGTLNFNQDINDWDVSSVTNMRVMFFGAKAFNQPIGSWDMSSVSNMQSMLEGASAFNQDISGWNVSSASNLSSFLKNASEFDRDLKGWTLPGLSCNFLDFAPPNWSPENYSRTLIGWANHIANGGSTVAQSFDANNTQYNNIVYAPGETFADAVSARDYLVNTVGWTITDGGLV